MNKTQTLEFFAILAGIAAVGSVVAFSRQIKPAYVKGDVISVFDFINSRSTTYTIMDLKDGKYALRQGVYPAITGSVIWVFYAKVENELVAQKITHVDLGN